MSKQRRVSGWRATRSLAEMDVVYILGKNASNAELRYSLRSLVNLPHRNVWLSGYRPHWLDGIKFIPGNVGATKEAKAYNNVLAAAKHPEVSDQFVLFNDDFFVTAPVTKLPPTYLLSLREHIDNPHLKDGAGPWKDSMMYTLELLESLGVTSPLSYEAHIPMVFDKQVLAEIMEPYVSDNPPQLRSLYGNLAKIGGTQQRQDVKALTAEPGLPISTPFFSTYPPTFAKYQAKLDAMFPEPTPEEKTGTARMLLAAAIIKKLAQQQGAG